MVFSSGVKLGDLDDFISAAQDCVKPLIQSASGGSAALDITADGLHGTRPRLGGASEEAALVQRPNLIKAKKSATDPRAEIGQVTLSDCLACSGCVTSAETVLLQAQSAKEFLLRSAEAPLTVVTLSAEARTSLASLCGLSPIVTFQKVAAMLQLLGARYVLESSAAEAIALLEGTAEFIRRYKAAGTEYNTPKLPLLTSHCPGWTCYAEKVLEPAVLPHLVPLRPPQQVQGRLVKTLLLEAHNRRTLHRWWRVHSPLFAAQCWWWLKRILRRDHLEACGCEPLAPKDVYHVVVQPCYDRKIEASRPQFEVESGVKEVDIVLTTTELLELITQVARDCGDRRVQEGEESPADAGARALMGAPSCPLDSEVMTDILLGDIRVGRPTGGPLLCSVRGNAESGGFIEHVFREAALHLFKLDIATPIKFTTRQNEDMREVLLKDDKDAVLLRFVAAYGFRNIQNVIRRVAKVSPNGAGAECGHFIEIMACPGGCLNGAGQIHAPKAGHQGARISSRAHLEEMEALLHSAPGTAVVRPEQHPLMLPIYRRIVCSVPTGAVPQVSAGAAAASDQPLQVMVGSAAVRKWFSADWRSVKVDAAGKQVVGTSALKW